MGYEMKVPVGMLFKKMFCCKCGVKLQKKKMSKIHFKGDAEFKSIKYGHTVILDKRQIIDSVVYFCPNCNEKIKPSEHHCKCGQALDWSDSDD